MNTRHNKKITLDKVDVAVSGGRTSAVMAKILWDTKLPGVEYLFHFTNTGCEHEGTYEFLRDIEKYWGIPIVWLEGVYDPQIGVGVRHKIVTFETASRDGKPYRDMTAKYGLPTIAYPHCSSRLKSSVAESYLKTIGWVKGKYPNHHTAIGIRVDEMDRVSTKKDEYKYLYPLIDNAINKEEVYRFMKKQEFDLNLPHEHLGNCTWCWKKPLWKLREIAKMDESYFDFPRTLEENYSEIKGEKKRFMFNNYKTSDMIIKEARHELEYHDQPELISPCSESCIPY